MTSALAGRQLWFRRQTDVMPSVALVHAFVEGRADSLCGDTAIIYRLDEIFDVLPDGARVCDRCREDVRKASRA